MKTRGFTLIELLVVIAIIAILASILFPVFAQAKLQAKKAVSISNLKQITLAGIMYTNDYDDLNPLGCGYYAPWNGWDWWDTFDVPYNWESGYGSDFYNNDEAVAWANAIYPYVKSWAVYRDPVGTPTPTWFGPNPAQLTPQYSSYTYNGLLTQWPSSAVAAPSQLSSYGILTGGTPNMGEAITSPQMICSNPNQNCIYQPATAATAPCPTPLPSTSSLNGSSSWTADITGYGGTTTTTTAWLYGKGLPYGMVDGHVKWRPAGGNIGGKTDYKVDPFSEYTATGYPNWYWADGSGCHPLQFEPDFDFSTWVGPWGAPKEQQ